MRYIVLISLLMMLIPTISSAETTNNLVSQDFTTGWSGTNLSSNHGSSTIAGVDGQYVESDSVSLSTDVGLNKNEINDGFTIDGSASIWFWNSYTQSVKQTITTVDDNDNIIIQNRTIEGNANATYYTTYTDQLIINDNTQEDYTISLRYDFYAPGTTGHYAADLQDPSLTITYTPKDLDTTTESNLIALTDTIEDDLYFEDFKEVEMEEEIKIEEKINMEESFTVFLMEEEKEEEAFEEPVMEVAMEEEKEEEEPVMKMMSMLEEGDENKEEESNSETTETTDAQEESNGEQKEVQSKETKTVGLTDVLEKIDEKIKDIDKNLQLKNLVKLKVMTSGNLLDAYNIPFYEPKDIYLDQVDIVDNRVIYDIDLIQYKQNDPISIKNEQLNRVLQERQNLINELQVLQNG